MYTQMHRKPMPLLSWALATLLVCLAMLSAGRALAQGLQPWSLAVAQQWWQQFTQSVPAAEGQFRQQQAGQAERRGRFAFQRPGQFAWLTDIPFEEALVSNGDVLLHYDPELQQLTERSAASALVGSPIAVLFGQESLHRHFTLQTLLQSPVPSQQALRWLRLLPLQSNSGFVHVDIGINDANHPVVLHVLDAFQQHSTIVLESFSVRKRLSADRFHLEVPSGVYRQRLD